MMNKELIIDLARKAGFDPHDMSDDFTCNLENILEFANLMIQECAGALVGNEAYTRHIGHAWREHFGIE
jgi:hypothetical protein